MLLWNCQQDKALADSLLDYLKKHLGWCNPGLGFTQSYMPPNDKINKMHDIFEHSVHCEKFGDTQFNALRSRVLAFVSGWEAKAAQLEQESLPKEFNEQFEGRRQIIGKAFVDPSEFADFNKPSIGDEGPDEVGENHGAGRGS